MFDSVLRRTIMLLTAIAITCAVAGSLLTAQTVSPSSFNNARAEDIRVSSVIKLEDSLCFPCAPSFSHDNKRLLYVIGPPSQYTPNPRSTIRFVDVTTGRPQQAIVVDGNVEQAIWAPDARRLFLVMKDYTGSVYDLTTTRATPIGSVPNGVASRDQIIWAEPSVLYFRFADAYWQGSSRFDLETLSARRLGLSHDRLQVFWDSLRTGGRPASAFQAGLGGRLLTIANRDGSFSHVIAAVSGDTSAVSSDGAYLAVRSTYYSRSSLYLIKLGLRPRIATEVTATLIDLPPLTADPNDLASIRARLARSEPVYGLVKRPRKNPLNGRLVGTEGNPLAVVRLTRVDGTTIQGHITVLADEVPEGTVLADLWEHTWDYSASLNGAPGGMRRYVVNALVTTITPSTSGKAEPTARSSPAPLHADSLQDEFLSAVRLIGSRQFEEGSRLLVKLAERGHALSQGWLAFLYQHGQGVPRDADRARSWYLKSASQGQPGAQFNLGLIYYSGDGVAKDPVEAERWFAAAFKGYSSRAQEGDHESEYQLGQMYSNGYGVTKDLATSTIWYRRAADGEFAPAQRSLGSAYVLGLGVAKDQATGVRWLTLAAKQGDAVAQQTLRILGVAW